MKYYTSLVLQKSARNLCLNKVKIDLIFNIVAFLILTRLQKGARNMLYLCRNNTNTTTKTKTNTNTNTNTITNTIAKKVRGICYISAGTMRRPAGGGNLSTNQVKSSSALNLFMILLKTNTTLQLDCRRIRPL